MERSSIFCTFRVNDILYYDTLFEGELIKQTDGSWSYQIIDLISHEGEDIRHLNLDKGIELIDHFLKEQYIYDQFSTLSTRKNTLSGQNI